MGDPTVQTIVPKSKQRRLQLGIRGLIGLVVLLGLVFGWLARMREEALEREAVVAELVSEHIIVNSRKPTLLCLVLAKLRCSRNVLPETPAKFEKWLSPGWFSLPTGFNAGRQLRDDDVPRVVERLQRLGQVHEVQFQGGSLNALRLFFIDEVPRGRLGPKGETYTIKSYPPGRTGSGSAHDGGP